MKHILRILYEAEAEPALIASNTAEAAETATEPVTFTPEFKLFKKLGSMSGTDWILFAIAAVVVIAAVALAVKFFRKKGDEPELKAASPVRALVYGAMCLALAFVLSYIKIFSLGFGGSITLCSMLPIMVYSYWYGPKYGLLCAFAYSLLQIVQGASYYTFVQFVLDYFLAFTALGLAGFFPKSLTVGVLVSGLARVIFSTISGAVFFGEYGLEYGLSPWAYSILYNGVLTIGPEVVLCLIVSALPPVRKMVKSLSPAKAK